MPQKKNSKNQLLLQAPKGMRDILPDEAPYWERVKKSLKEIAGFYNFDFIDTPILERADLFTRGIGLSTDIVEKEMYILKTKGGDRLALRPEFTAPVMRAYIEHGMSRLPQPVKLYYFGSVFRHESPQAGRLREFHQVGFEIMGGETDPIYDAQIILAAVRFLEELKIKNFIVRVNSIGCKICRPVFRKKLQDYYKKQLSSAKKKKIICKDCERRLATNPLRLLDCKNELCVLLKEQAPGILDSLCANCRSHFKGVLEFLDEVAVPYALDPCLVRGLDYYNRTVFEIFEETGNLALAAGGRYDYLAEFLGEKPIPAVGVAPGVERIIEILKAKTEDKEKEVLERKLKDRLFVVHVGEVAKKKALVLIENLRRSNVRVAEALGKDSLQAQLKMADKKGAVLALIIGQKEVYEESVIMRDMVSGLQETVPIKKIIEVMKKRLG